MFKKILIVCTGNICRSPMMEGQLRARLAGRDDVQISSAGTGALVDRPAEPFAVEVMAEQGIDITAHRARQLDEKILYGADVVLAMERAHQRWIDANFPVARGRVFLAGHWRKNAEVPDPFMGPRAGFEAAAAQLALYSGDWLTKLGL